MELGDHMYVILAIVFSAAGALRKRQKKSSSNNKNTSRVQDVFNEIFDGETPEDPVQHLETYTEDDIVLPIEDLDDETMGLMQEYEALQNRPIEETVAEVVLFHEEEKHQARKHHHLLEDLKDRKELQKALIYSEIFKPKFKSL